MQALAEADTLLWDVEVPDDEGGISVPLPATPSRDELPTVPATHRGPRSPITKRHPDEVTTAPGRAT